MNQVRIRKQARKELEDILKYTKDNWGEQQVSIFINQFDDLLFYLSFSPHLGRKTKLLNTYTIPFSKLPFVILYEVKDDFVIVNKVIHTKCHR